MASSTARSNGKASKRKVTRPRLTYFYLNGDLHKKMLIDRPNDLLTAWNYPKGKLVKYNYTDTLSAHKKAFTTKQVCELLGRSRFSVEYAIINKQIEPPQHTYAINEHRRKFKYMWREEDVLALHKFFASISIGRPRRDGVIVTDSKLPTVRELRAMMRDEEILYVKQGDGFVPTFRAKEWK